MINSLTNDIRLIPDPFDAILVVFELLLTITDVDCDVASAFGDVTGLRDVFMLAKTVSRCFGSKYCCIIDGLFLSEIGMHATLELEDEEDNGGFVNPVGGGG